MRFKLFTSLFLLLILIVPAFAQGKTSVAKQVFEQAMKQRQQKNESGYKEALDNFKRAYKLYETANDKSGMADSLFRIGQTYRNLDDLKNAYEFYVAAGNLYSEIGKEKETIFTVNNIASIQRDTGNYNEAIKTYEGTVIPYMLKYGDKIDLAQVYNGVGQSYLNIREPAKALSFFEKSLTNWQLSKEKDFDEVRATYGSAIASFQLGNKPAAKSFAVKSINLAQTFNAPVLQAEVLEALAQVYNDDGDTAEAIKYRLQALNLYDRNKSKVSRNAYETVVNNLAFTYYKIGDMDAAQKILTASIQPGVKGQDAPVQSYLIGSLGEVFAERGDYENAVEALNTAIRIGGEANDLQVQAYSYNALGDIYLKRANLIDRNYQPALENFQKALAMFQTEQNPEVEAVAVSGLVSVYGNTGQINNAQQYVNRLTNAGLEKGDTAQAIHALDALGKFYAFSGDQEQAISHFTKAYQLAKKRNSLTESLDILNNVSQSLLQVGKFSEALANFKITQGVYKKFGNKYLEGFATVQAGWSSLYLNQTAEASNYAQAADAIANATNNTQYGELVRINTLHIRGKANFRNGDYKTALEYIEKCLAVAQKVGDKPSEKHFWEDIAQTQEALGNNKEAKKARKNADKIK